MRKSRTVHRGLANRSDHPRALMYIAFESDEGQHPSTFIREKEGTEERGGGHSAQMMHRGDVPEGS